MPVGEARAFSNGFADYRHIVRMDQVLDTGRRQPGNAHGFGGGVEDRIKSDR